VADENIDWPIIDRLRSDGHAVTSIRELNPGISDSEVLRRAVAEQAILLTEDKDLGDMVFRDSMTMHGIVLIRLAGLPGLRKAAIVSRALRDHEPDLAGNFAVVGPSSIRIRRRNALSNNGDLP
jgi:predicted nuclease of predicted toxin-antitoxin system